MIYSWAVQQDEGVLTLTSILNWIGQLRLYSLVDLGLLLAVAQATIHQLLGGLCLHVGFLLLLEGIHKDRGRLAFPFALLLVAWVTGFVLFGNFSYAIAYFGFSLLYSLKKVPWLGWSGPLARGGQTAVLVGGVLAVEPLLVWCAAALLLVRNLVGDFRDVAKDREEGVRTLPVLLGFTRDFPYAHQLCVHFTTAVWCWWGGLEIYWLGLAWAVQLLTYRLTPR